MINDSLFFDNLFSLFSSISIWFVFKVLVLLSLLLYIVFAGVIVKQINIMVETLTDQLELPIKLVAAIHLAGAILVFVLAFLIL